MIWMIVFALSALCAVVTMCSLIIARQADERKEALFADRLADVSNANKSNKKDVASSISVRDPHLTASANPGSQISQNVSQKCA